MKIIIAFLIFFIVGVILLYFIYRNNKAKADEFIEDKVEPGAKKLDSFWDYIKSKFSAND